MWGRCRVGLWRQRSGHAQDMRRRRATKQLKKEVPIFIQNIPSAYIKHIRIEKLIMNSKVKDIKATPHPLEKSKIHDAVQVD